MNFLNDSTTTTARYTPPNTVNLKDGTYTFTQNYIVEEIKENKIMNNYDFGPCNSNVRMSMYGLATKNVSGNWVSYDAEKHALVEVDAFILGNKFLYKMPIAIKDLKIGDIIIHMHKPMFITKVNENSCWAVDPVDRENKEITLALSPFGYPYCIKVINILDNINTTTPSVDNPFGNMLPMMLMNTNKIDPMLLMYLNGDKIDMSNPMMLYFLTQK